MGEKTGLMREGVSGADGGRTEKVSCLERDGFPERDSRPEVGALPGEAVVFLDRDGTMNREVIGRDIGTVVHKHVVLFRQIPLQLQQEGTHRRDGRTGRGGHRDLWRADEGGDVLPV